MEISDDVGFNKSVIKNAKASRENFQLFQVWRPYWIFFYSFSLFCFLFSSFLNLMTIFSLLNINSILCYIIMYRIAAVFFFYFLLQLFISNQFFIIISFLFYTYLVLFQITEKRLLTQTATSTSAAIINVF